MASHMSNSSRISLIIALVVIVSVLATLWAVNFEQSVPPLEPRPFPPDMPSFKGDFQLYYIVKNVISSINITLGSILLVTYVSLYKKLKSEFVIGFTLFSLIFLFYAVFSNPVLQFIFGFRAFGLGPFAMLPDLFASFALGVLIYLTLKY
jgi:hypothetical protein